MANGIDIHEREKSFETSIKRIKSINMYGSNKETILIFIDYILSGGISKARALRYLDVLPSFEKELAKDFRDSNINDMRRVVGKIEQNDKYKAWTKHTHKVCLKRFYKYLNGDKDYPETVSWIKCHMKKSEMNLPNEGELITEEETNMLIKACSIPRDKCL